jgi:hypothetical protein
MVNVDVSPGNINCSAQFLRRSLLSGGRPQRQRAKIRRAKFYAREMAENAGVFDIHYAMTLDERFMLKR